MSLYYLVENIWYISVISIFMYRINKLVFVFVLGPPSDVLPAYTDSIKKKSTSHDDEGLCWNQV